MKYENFKLPSVAKHPTSQNPQLLYSSEKASSLSVLHHGISPGRDKAHLWYVIPLSVNGKTQSLPIPGPSLAKQFPKYVL